MLERASAPTEAELTCGDLLPTVDTPAQRVQEALTNYRASALAENGIGDLTSVAGFAWVWLVRDG